jgi:hypothetical protein
VLRTGKANAPNSLLPSIKYHGGIKTDVYWFMTYIMMSHLPAKRHISVNIDAQLLDDIDKLATSERTASGETNHRSSVFEEALRLWRVQKIEGHLQEFYQHQSLVDVESEEEWAQTAQNHLEASLEAENL